MPRGRPPVEQPLSNAERSRRYRTKKREEGKTPRVFNLTPVTLRKLKKKARELDCVVADVLNHLDL